MIIRKFLSSEKSFNAKDKGTWTFMVNPKANKSEIKKAIESLFTVTVASVNTSRLAGKLRRIKGSRMGERRALSKIARVRLSKESKALDLAKLKK